MPFFQFDEDRFYRFCVALGIKNLLRNRLALGWKKTLGKISQPINSYTRFPEYWYFDREIKRCIEAQPRGRITKILDVGSPKALGLYVAFHYPVEIHLTDITALNLAEYQLLWDIIRQTAAGRATFSMHDARSLGYSAGVFDIAYSMSVIEHVGGDMGDTTSMRELMRVIRSGGQLIASVPFGRTYVEQFRRGFAGAAHKTNDETTYFFQRIYDRSKYTERLIDGAAGLSHVNCLTVWRKNAGVARAFGSLGENLRGLLGPLNPFLSALVNRTQEGVSEVGANYYGAESTDQDVYGDLLFNGQKSGENTP